MVEKRAAVDGRLDASPGTVEKSHTKRLLQAGNGRGHDGLRDGEMVGRLRHAAPLHHREQHMQVAEFEAASDPILPTHVGHS